MSVARAQQEVSSAEFGEWMAYYSIDPFGERRADMRIAILSTLVANALRKKGGRRFQTKDFMPRFDGAARQSAEEAEANLMFWYRMHKKRDN